MAGHRCIERGPNFFVIDDEQRLFVGIARVVTAIVENKQGHQRCDVVEIVATCHGRRRRFAPLPLRFVSPSKTITLRGKCDSLVWIQKWAAGVVSADGYKVGLGDGIHAGRRLVIARRDPYENRCRPLTFPQVGIQRCQIVEELEIRWIFKVLGFRLVAGSNQRVESRCVTGCQIHPVPQRKRQPHAVQTTFKLRCVLVKPQKLLQGDIRVSRAAVVYGFVQDGVRVRIIGWLPGELSQNDTALRTREADWRLPFEESTLGLRQR